MSGARVLTYGEALREAQAQAMARDPRVVVMGQGVDDLGGIFGSTLDLHKEFGSARCFDMPLAEESITGIANGAALAGLRPVVVHARLDFLLLAMNQIVSHAAKWRFMFGRDNTMPVVYRGIVGRGWGQGSQHSQSLQAMFMHVPGLKVAVPASPYDAKGLLVQALSQQDPVVFIEHRQLYGAKGEVPADFYAVPFGLARVARAGTDVTIVAISQMVEAALAAAEALAREGVSVEVVDPRTLAPLDDETVFASVRKTGRLVVADNGWLPCGAGAEIAARAASACFDALKAPVARIGFPPFPTPSSHVLEAAYYPNWETIVAAVQKMLRRPVRARREARDEKGLRESW